MKKYFLPFCFMALMTTSCDQQQRNGEDRRGQDTLVDQQQQQRVHVSLEELWSTEQVLETPESVYYHADEDILYVSNIAGDPTEKNESGYISRLSPDGELVEQRWVTGLHAPKGMGMMDGKLYVADVDQLVEIDVAQGQISNRYPVEGATFLNDVTVTNDGQVLFSDSNEGRIHAFEDGQVRIWNDQGFDRPNGLLAHNGKILLATSGGGEVMEVSEGERGERLAEGIGHGDGVVAVDEDAYLVSNWQGEVYYIGSDRVKTKLLDTRDQNINAADIEYIQERDLLLVPTFRDNRVVAYRLNRNN